VSNGQGSATRPARLVVRGPSLSRPTGQMARNRGGYLLDSRRGHLLDDRGGRLLAQ
jgi:hypothetical protein